MLTLGHSNFFAYLSKLRWIERWGMKRNTVRENVMEHSFEVAVLAHVLGVLHNRLCADNTTMQPVDVAELVLTALFHDASEVLTGDLPSPIKYHNAKIRDAYKEVEHAAERELLAMLPPALREDYAPLLLSEQVKPEIKKIVKAADVLTALVKCKTEVLAGNVEFKQALADMEARAAHIELPAVQVFMAAFLPAFDLTLDELLPPQV